MRSSTTSPPSGSFERLRPGQSHTKRPNSQFILGLLLGSAFAGIIACLLFVRSRPHIVHSIVESTQNMAATAINPVYSTFNDTTSDALDSYLKDETVSATSAPATSGGAGPSPLAHLSSPLLKGPTLLPHDFWFVKTKKVGGSTLKGILNAICAHHAVTCLTMPKDPSTGESIGKWDVHNGPAQINRYKELGFEHLAITDHGKYSKVLAEHLNNPLLFTAVRDPVDRFISQFFFVYRQGGPPEASDLLTPTMAALAQGQGIPPNVLEEMKKFADHEANLVFKDICDAPATCNPEEAVAPYDFIFVQEKFDESLVVFALEYGLSYQDIAYTSAKNQTGKYPTVAQIPAETVEYIKQRNDLDGEIYQMAASALDTRIANLRDMHAVDPAHNADFDAILADFKNLQAEVVRECSDHMHWYEKHGFSDSYFYSQDGGAVGEGFRCIDYVARRFEAGLLD